MPFASGPHPDTVRPCSFSAAPTVPETLSQTGRPSMRSSLGVHTDGSSTLTGSGTNRTPGRPISAIPTGRTIGAFVYQLMVFTWRTASIVNLNVVPEILGKPTGTLTTASAAFWSRIAGRATSSSSPVLVVILIAVGTECRRSTMTFRSRWSTETL